MFIYLFMSFFFFLMNVYILGDERAFGGSTEKQIYYIFPNSSPVHDQYEILPGGFSAENKDDHM